MRAHLKLGLATLAATIALSTLVSTASAGRLSISEQNIRAVWSALEFEASGITIRCSITVEGTFHYRSIIKVERSLIGYVTRGIVRRPCTGGTSWAYNGTETNEVLGGTFANSLPWHNTYEGFSGTLPSIQSVSMSIDGFRFRIRDPVFGLLCDYTTGNRGRWKWLVRIAVGILAAIRSSGRITSETAGCPEGNLLSRAEDGLITVLGSTTTRISVTRFSSASGRNPNRHIRTKGEHRCARISSSGSPRSLRPSRSGRWSAQHQPDASQSATRT